MSAVGKEFEHQPVLDKATQPIEQMGYVEKVEKQTEVKQPSSAQAQQVPVDQNKATGDMGQIVSAQFAVQTKPKIVLPLDQKEVTEGLHHGVKESIRWLSEWCVMMIKKYPGRVFYLPPES